MLERGAVGHNHLWYHRDAIEAFLAARDPEGVMQHVKALEDYASAEPLPWSNLFAARGRALATTITNGKADEGARADLARVRASLASAAFRPFLPAVETALAE